MDTLDLSGGLEAEADCMCLADETRMVYYMGGFQPYRFDQRNTPYGGIFVR